MKKTFALTAAMVAAQIGGAQAEYVVYDAPNNFEVLRTFATACYQQSKTAKVIIWVKEKKEPDERQRLSANCEVEYKPDYFVVWHWHEGLPVTEKPDLQGWLRTNEHPH